MPLIITIKVKQAGDGKIAMGAGVAEVEGEPVTALEESFVHHLLDKLAEGEKVLATTVVLRDPSAEGH